MLKQIFVALVLCLCIGRAEIAENVQKTTEPGASSGRKLWIASLAALGAASVLDATSSWHKRELNPLLRNGNGEFGARAVTIKVSVTTAGVLCQWLILRKHPKSFNTTALVNFGVAGALTDISVHNFRLKK